MQVTQAAFGSQQLHKLNSHTSPAADDKGGGAGAERRVGVGGAAQPRPHAGAAGNACNEMKGSLGGKFRVEELCLQRGALAECCG
jgi:hypothetical protein